MAVERILTKFQQLPHAWWYFKKCDVLLCNHVIISNLAKGGVILVFVATDMLLLRIVWMCSMRVSVGRRGGELISRRRN